MSFLCVLFLFYDKRVWLANFRGTGVCIFSVYAAIAGSTSWACDRGKKLWLRQI